MGRSGRRWSILKWAGLSVSLLIALVPVALFSRDVRYRAAFGSPGSAGGSWVFGLRLYEGRLDSEFGRGRISAGDLGWRIDANLTPAWQLKPDWGRGSTTSYRVSWVEVPLWIPFLIIAVSTAYLWWLDRRRIPPGHCRKCGYNLTGNVSGVCPDCGEGT